MIPTTARSGTIAGPAGFLAVVACGLALLFGAPHVTESFGLVQMTGFAALAMFALSQGFVWGYGGIMSFGQAAFLGLGGYAYAVSVINLGDSTLPVLIAIAVPMLFAAALGYFMFFGRISDAYVGVITLTVSVILFQLFNTTSGSQYRIGQAELGGFNGIPAIPVINRIGEPGEQLDIEGLWAVAMSALILVYVLLRAILASRLGRVIVAIRENETRAQLIGYDPRLYKLLAFTISAGIAGLAGCLYANWGGFISPTVFGLSMSAQVIIYVLVGGLGTLIGPMLGAVLIQSLIIAAGTQSMVDSNLGLGLVLVGFVLLVPEGLVPVARRLVVGAAERFTARKRATPGAEPAAANPALAEGGGR
ncbi:branched-chain amino acid ABC transporter permease [Methylobacterium planeticum]|uniref:Branched-chain amino acid ABC transporter permease n=1 Tax=Methylobacterium planeticum TaxID=2615211 RepID=A0A6N6MJA5_9HYPH|nr:branched-chain amino acid ABC transporter permease [Methylobacterium planeticum]KAB1068918.1 branched-chain amino acid ABC transporter permease [Methylobacterium planeticum]